MRSFSVTPSGDGARNGFVALALRTAGGARTAYLPVIAELGYRVVARGALTLSAPDATGRIVCHSGARALLDRLRAATTFKRKKILRFGVCDILPIGSPAALRAFYAVTKQMRRSGYALDGATVRRFPELVLGWADGASDPSDIPPPSGDNAPSIGVVVHVYYAELWPEIAAALRGITRPFDLHVTTPRDAPDVLAAILEAFPAARIHKVANRGRDVAPFLHLLETGALDGYTTICKLHTKKSADGGRNPIQGALWRNRLLFDLVAAPGVVERIVERFETDARAGIIGSPAYRFPNRLCNPNLSWGGNRARVLALAARMGIAAADFRLDFFCGSMFWIRRAALEPLRGLRLTDAFEEERGGLDGELEHAVERLFTTSAEVAGMTIVSITGAALEAGAWVTT